MKMTEYIIDRTHVPCEGWGNTCINFKKLASDYLLCKCKK